MSVLLDTDICSAFLRGRDRVVTKVQQLSGNIAVSAISAGELYDFVSRRQASRRYSTILNAFLQDVRILAVDENVAQVFGGIRAGLLDVGRPLPVADHWIASTAIQHGLTLVTHNTADFQDIPGLRLDDWIS